MNSGKKTVVGDLILILLFGALMYVPWVNLPVTDADTAYYSTAARGVVDSGDWMTLRGSGGGLLDKPPLSIWPIALSYRLWGQHDWSTRLWQVILSLGTLLLTYLFGRRFFGREECLLATLILATSLLFAYCTMVVQQDILNVFTYVLFFYAFALFWQTHSAAPYYLAWLALSLSFMNRWHVALVIPAGVVLACVIAARMLGRDDFRVTTLFGSWRSALLRTLLGLMIFAAVGGTWYVYEYLRLGRPFLDLFFGRRNLAFLQGPGGRPLSWLSVTYLPQLLLAVIPWVVLLPDAVATGISGLRALRRARTREADGLLFVSLWFLVAFLVPHVSAWRVIRYLLPVLPPLAILMAVGVARKLRERGRFAISAVISAAMTLIFLVIDVYLIIQPLDAGLRPYRGLILPFLLMSTVGFAAFTLAALWRRERLAIVSMVILAVASYSTLFASVSYKWDQVSPWRSFGLRVRTMLQQGTQLAWYRAGGTLPYGVPGEAEKVVYEYYAGRSVPFLQEPSELRDLVAQGPAVIVMRDETLTRLLEARPELDLQKIQAHSTGWVLVLANSESRSR
ncbi:MAG: ArnT family glycosyltransferase [Betaproteobacteria bacterium]